MAEVKKEAEEKRMFEQAAMEEQVRVRRAALAEDYENRCGEFLVVYRNKYPHVGST